MAQPPGQFMHHFFEDNTVDVLAEHVEEEPVAHLGLFDDGVDNLKPNIFPLQLSKLQYLLNTSLNAFEATL